MCKRRLDVLGMHISNIMHTIDLVIIGHVAVGLLALGMLMFFWMISKGLRKVKKRGRKASKRLRKFNLYLKNSENLKRIASKRFKSLSK